MVSVCSHVAGGIWGPVFIAWSGRANPSGDAGGFCRGVCLAVGTGRAALEGLGTAVRSDKATLGEVLGIMVGQGGENARVTFGDDDIMRVDVWHEDDVIGIIQGAGKPDVDGLSCSKGRGCGFFQWDGPWGPGGVFLRLV